jgi:NADPH:quinone reductase-like Zn-dependent oxidoreductase
MKEIHRLTSEDVDVVFDSIGGTHIWRSRKALSPGGAVVAYGLTSSLRGGDWRQVVRVVVVAFGKSPFSGCALLAAGAAATDAGSTRSHISILLAGVLSPIFTE